MAKSARPSRSKRKGRSPRTKSSENAYPTSSSTEAVKAAEKLAMDAFASGLRVAAVFGTVAAKTTSLALASLATGADKFSELIRKEATQSTSPSRRKVPHRTSHNRRKKSR